MAFFTIAIGRPSPIPLVRPCPVEEIIVEWQPVNSHQAAAATDLIRVLKQWGAAGMRVLFQGGLLPD
jgi:hypothetical protein